MNKSTCSLFLFVILGFFASGQPTQRNLDYYLEAANDRNPYLQEFSLQQKIAGLEIQKIKRQFEKPQWTITGDYLLAPYFFNNGRVLAITATPETHAFGYDAGITNGGLYSGQVNANLQLLTQKQSRPLIQQQELSQMRMQNQSRLFEANLDRQITGDFLNAYLVQQQMDYVQQVKDRLIEQREFIRKLTDRGLMRVTDLELLSLEIKNQDYQLNNLRLQFRQAIQLLHTDVGITDTSFFRLEETSLDPMDANAVSLFLKQYQLDSLSAVNDQAVFETRYVPQLNVFANGGLNAVDLNNVYRKVGISTGIHVSWLFGDGGQRTINAQQNEIRQLNARNQAQFVDQQIQNNRLNNALLLQQNHKNIQILNRQLEGYEKLLTTYRQELALGQLTVMDYIIILRTYKDLQQQKAQIETQSLLIINEANYWNN